MEIANDPAPGRRYLTTTQAREYLLHAYGYELQPWTLLRWTKAGKVIAHRRQDAPKYRYTYTRESLDALMDSMGIVPVEASY